jgi:hypothetical protein
MLGQFGKGYALSNKNAERLSNKNAERLHCRELHAECNKDAESN